MKRNRKAPGYDSYPHDLDVWMFEWWWSDDIKRESEQAYQNYLKTSIKGRRDKMYRILNSLVKKDYVEKRYNEPKSITYRLKDQYDNPV